MNKVKIFPYKIGSASARLLAQHLQQQLGYKIWRIRSPLRARPNQITINWGQYAPVLNAVNLPVAVAWARDKIESFRHFNAFNVPTLDWTIDPLIADCWLAEGKPVYCRTTVTGQGGIGIQVFHGTQDIPVVPLYTKYFSAKSEYRVHVMNDQVIDYAKKKRKLGEEGNKYIRNHNNGYVFARVGVQIPLSVANAARVACKSLGLYFGAADVLHNERKDHPAVLEVNTAPGLDNHTVESYAKAFIQSLELLREE